MPAGKAGRLLSVASGLRRRPVCAASLGGGAHRRSRLPIRRRRLRGDGGDHGCLLDEGPHLARLARSMAELRIAPPMSNPALRIVMREVIRRNGVRDGIVYVQVTRGVAARDQAFPVTARPVLVVTARCKRRGDPRAVSDGVAVITIPTFAGSAATSNQWLSCRTCLASSGPRRLVSSRLGK